MLRRLLMVQWYAAWGTLHKACLCGAVALENVVTTSRVRIRFNETLGSELGGIVNGMCKLALEQLEEEGHPGWCVLEWEACSLRTYLLAQVSVAIGLGPSLMCRLDSMSAICNLARILAGGGA